MKSVYYFILGMIEFRTELTSSVPDDYIETYDSGRDFAHRLTLRMFDHG